MRLTRIEVESFQCIEQAALELGPALNVLYGPNDLGKSSLAAAVRAVLLLQAGSTVLERFVSWQSGAPPRVCLCFATPDGRHWRVKKVFAAGGRGTATLESSKDGVSYQTDCNAREVDGKLRQMLRWGVPTAGGGKVRDRGLSASESFLAQVLLAEQADVPAILAQGITGDRDESGKERLVEALQALAQDPDFKRVLDAAQKKVDEAFTDTGKPKRGRQSPFAKISEEIARLRDQREELTARANQTDALLETLRTLDDEVGRLATAKEEAEVAVQVARVAAEKRRAREQAEKARADAQRVVAEIEQLLGEADSARAHCAGAEAVLGGAVAAFAAAERLVADAEAALGEVEAKRATSPEAAREYDRRRAEIDAQRLQSDRDQLALDQRRDVVTAAEALVENLNRAEEDFDTAAERAAAAEVEAGSASEARRGADQLIDVVATARLVGNALRAEEDLAKARDAAARGRDLRARATASKSEADALAASVAARNVPPQEVIDRLRTLRAEHQNAEAALGGGVSLAFRPCAEVDTQVRRDGSAAQARRGSGEIAVEAQRTIELTIAGVGDVIVTAGEERARSRAAAARTAWERDGAPVLQAAGVASIEELASSRRDLDTRLARAAELGREAHTLDERAAEQEIAARDLQRLEGARREADLALDGKDVVAARRLLETLGAGWRTGLETQGAAAERAAADARKRESAAMAEAASLRAVRDEKRIAFEALEKEVKARLAVFAGGLDAARDQLATESERLVTRRAEIDRAIAKLAAEQAELEARMQKELETARRAADAARADREVKRAARETASLALATGSARLVELERRAASADLAAARDALEQCVAAVESLDGADASITEAELALREAKLVEATSALDGKRDDLQQARGGLELIGGAVVRDKLDEVTRALDLTKDRERDLELEYAGWQLLASTLREVETTQGIHLGKALAGPVSARFGELTAGRYGTVALGPELRADGLMAAGQLREIGALSLGTQEQLATVFRLCIAEQLQTAIVLDDHLTQTDPDRVRWFSDLLRRAAEKIQIVILTCRPRDYLEVDELPTGDDATRDLAGGQVRAINLRRVVRRYAASAS